MFHDSIRHLHISSPRVAVNAIRTLRIGLDEEIGCWRVPILPKSGEPFSRSDVSQRLLLLSPLLYEKDVVQHAKIVCFYIVRVGLQDTVRRRCRRHPRRCQPMGISLIDKWCCRPPSKCKWSHRVLYNPFSRCRQRTRNGAGAASCKQTLTPVLCAKVLFCMMQSCFKCISYQVQCSMRKKLLISTYRFTCKQR